MDAAAVGIDSPTSVDKIEAMTDSRAILVGGPENGGTVFLGALKRRPRKIDFLADRGSSVARYIRATRFQFDARRSGGCSEIGQTAYRFIGFVEP